MHALNIKNFDLKKNILYTKSIDPSNIEKKWLLVDASNISLGRLATQVAYLIRGKNKPYFTPHVDCGDNVIVKNADKIIVIKEGKIIEEGTHNNLIQNKSLYNDLYNLQKIEGKSE